MSNLRDRDEIEEKYKWNLESVYATTKEFYEDEKLLKSMIIDLKKHLGKLNTSSGLEDYLKALAEVERKQEKQYIYAENSHHTDIFNTAIKEILNSSSNNRTELDCVKISFNEEIITYGKEFIFDLLVTDYLVDHKQYFDRIFYENKYKLPKTEESILTEYEHSIKSFREASEALREQDITFEKVKDINGNDLELSNLNYKYFLTNYDRSLRKSGFFNYYNKLGEYKNTLCSLYGSHVKAKVSIAKSRNINSSLESQLYKDELPQTVHDNIYSSINNNLHLYHRYISIKKNELELDDFNVYDLDAPNSKEESFNFSIEEAKNIIKESLSVLGEEYVNILDEAFENRWIDIFPCKGKGGTLFCNSAYDTLPFCTVNYNNDINDMVLMAHELGHSINAYYFYKEQPFLLTDWDYVNTEVIATVNEILLLIKMKDSTNNKKLKKHLIWSLLKNYENHLFRQAMFGEFEMNIHKQVENNSSLTTDSICDCYYNTVKKYLGENIELDRAIEMEWSTVPHFYITFYVYKYAIGFVAALAIVDKILNDENDILDKYFNFLKAGRSNYTINQQKDLGIDLTTIEPFDIVMKRFEDLLNEYENL